MAWGLAEEAGKAVRWLELRCIASVPMMRHHLETHSGAAFAEIAPDISGETWTAPGGTLCPIAAGAAVSDHLDGAETGARISLGATACPVLLAGIIGRAAEATGRVISVTWADETLVLCNAGPDTGRIGSALLMARLAETVTVDFDFSPIDVPQGRPPGTGALSVADEDWNALKALAARTYVPESEQSRLSGAGAGLSDND